jgi:Skp family chaperone for outer membrane proteins
MAKTPSMNVLRTLPATLAICCWAFTAQQTSADIKSATVDVNKLLTDYHVAKKKISALKAERGKYTKERDERQKSLKEVADKITALITKLRSKAMPQSERDNLSEEYEDLISQYKALNKDLAESDLGQIKETKENLALSTRQLLDEIQIVIHQFAKDNGYHWIIDTSGVSNTQISPLIYARDSKDVTEEILVILNKDAPKAEESSKPQTPKTKPE